MSRPVTQITYAGTALPLANETVVIFSTVSAGMGAGMAQGAGYKKLCLVLDNDATCTANLYVGLKTATAAAGWSMVTSTAITPTGTTTTNNYEWIISSMPHFKLEIVNSTTTQTTFGVYASLVDERAT
jgi:hypothetical protein